MKKYSVIVLSYNSKEAAMKATLDSVRTQEGVELEIILADDCSSNTCLQWSINYLAKCGQECKVMAHPRNVGTVQNIADALEMATGEYVKCIGAGDLLYQKNTLQKTAEFLEETGCAMCFGRMQGYYEENGKKKYLTFSVPADLKAFQQNNYQRIRKNIIKHHGWIAGASMFYNRELFHSYLQEIVGHVRYCEDLLQVVLLLHHEKIGYFEEPVMYYEVGSGISTNAGNGNSTRMQKDHEGFWKWVMEAYPQVDLLKKGYKMHRLESIKEAGRRKRNIILKNPGYVRMQVKTKMQRSLYEI